MSSAGICIVHQEGIEPSVSFRKPRPQRGASANSAISALLNLVRPVGIEPTCPKTADFKSAAYTNFATVAFNKLWGW